MTQLDGRLRVPCRHGWLTVSRRDHSTSSIYGTRQTTSVIVDAMRSTAPAGTILRFDAGAEPLPVGAFRSTHAFGPAAVIELARMMRRLPRSLIVYGIEIADTTYGAPLSRDVAIAVSSVARELQDA